MSNAMILYQEYRNFFERKNAEVLIHTASFEEASDPLPKILRIQENNCGVLIYIDGFANTFILFS